jgi:hypothetical protein
MAKKNTAWKACGLGVIDEADVATASRRGGRVSHTGFAMGRRNRSLRRLSGGPRRDAVATIFVALTGQSPTLLGNSAYVENRFFFAVFLH